MKENDLSRQNIVAIYLPLNQKEMANTTESNRLKLTSTQITTENHKKTSNNSCISVEVRKNNLLTFQHVGRTGDVLIGEVIIPT